MLHGFSGDGSTWRGISADLAQYYQLVALDLLGHGRSDAPPDARAYAIDRAAADIISLLDALDLPQVHLLGYSMGGGWRCVWH